MPGPSGDDGSTSSLPSRDSRRDSSIPTANPNEMTGSDRPFRRVFFRGPTSENRDSDASNQRLALRPYISSPPRERVRTIDATLMIGS